MLLHDERVAACGRQIAPKAKDAGGVLVEPQAVKVDWRPSDGRVHYRNLVVCARVWQCPVCAARITEQRRAELTQAMMVAQKRAYGVLHVILTLRHKNTDKLPVLLGALTEASRGIKSGRWFKKFKVACGWLGSVKALEVTHGDNGWHPHQHELVFLKKPLTESELKALTIDLKKRWNAVLMRSGCDASWEHGIIVKTAYSDLADYIAKFGHDPEDWQWSPEHEITKNPSKLGRQKGRTPMQLLDDSSKGDKRAGWLFTEYAHAFKGKKQLQWSNGLRQLLLAGDEISDSDLLEHDNGDDEVTLTRLWADEWKRVLTLKLRADLLEVASAGKADLLESWLVQKGVRKSQADELSAPNMRGAGASHHGDESERDESARRWMLRHDAEDWNRVELIDRDTGEIFNHAEN